MMKVNSMKKHAVNYDISLSSKFISIRTHGSVKQT